ncbi:hypothetical protein L2E82_11222 [Cichorium intybus]|uniref:Uncharacterized protein n=1 Tax=Cichorium intybus TaxID=13427 RepID=A0ACB9GDF4_CICIN|nr:hypothetical protein L2E82_11222 [Cichorium intybus]
MLASVDFNDNQFEFDNWDPRWGDEDIDSDDELQEQEAPEYLPDNLWNRTDAGADDEGEANGREDVQFWESETPKDNKCARDAEKGNWDNEFCDNRELTREEEVVSQPRVDSPQTVQDSGPRNSFLEKKTTSGPKLNCEHVLGQSLLSQSMSINLNENPKSSTPGVSRTSIPRSNENSLASNSSPPSINQTNTTNQDASISSSQEIDITMELGEKIGFQFGGKKDQAMKLLKKQGVSAVHQ